MGYSYRIIFAFGVAGLFIAAGIFLHDGHAITLAIPFLAYVAVLVARPEPTAAGTDLAITRQLDPPRLTANTDTTVTITVHNTGRPIAWLGIIDSIPAGVHADPDATTTWLGPLPTGEIARISYTVHAARGKYEFGDVQLQTWSRAGTGPVVDTVAAPAHLLVIPEWQRLKKIEIRPRRTRVYSGIIRADVGGTGTDFFGSRAYVRGDNIRRINWRAYARTGKLIITEYEQERIADVNVILDARAAANSEPELFERGISAAASVADLFLSQGNRVGLLIYGDVLNWTYPGFGTGQRERILDALAAATLGDKPVFADLRYIPARLFPARSQLVVISPLAGEKDVEVFGILRARGYQIILISPDPISHWRTELGGTDTPSAAAAVRILRLKRRVLTSALARIGVAVVDWNTENSLLTTVNWALARQSRRVR